MLNIYVYIKNNNNNARAISYADRRPGCESADRETISITGNSEKLVIWLVS